MDDMALFAAGYYAGKKKRDGPPSPLSLEGIMALNTLATVTVGSFIFKIKEPKIFFAGALSLDGDGAVMNSAWLGSVVVNDSVAYIGHGRIATEYFAWGNYNYGNNSTYFMSYSDFKVTDVKFPYEQDYPDYLPHVSVNMSFIESCGYDGVISDSRSGSGQDILYPNSSTDVKFTNLSPYDYFQFVKSYAEARKVSEPVINIL